MNKAFCSLLLLISLSAYLSAGPHHKKVLNLSDGKYARINDTLYAAIYELKNENYKAFLSAIYKDSGLSLYQKCLYDSSSWDFTSADSNNEPIEKGRHIRAPLMPVINVPWYGAMKYCEWLTAKNDLVQGKKHGKLLFKLPSEKEWILIACADHTGFPSGLHDGEDATGQYQLNIKTKRQNGVTVVYEDGHYWAKVWSDYDDGGYYTVRVDSYRPNAYGLYNIIGNVSEMTDTKDIEKGGNWWSEFADCSVDKKETWPTPDPRVGFRVVTKVVKHPASTRP